MSSAAAAPAAKLVRVLALSGSLRKLSANSALLRFAQSAAPALGAEIVIGDAHLPLFDQDEEAAGYPAAALCVPRAAIRAACAVALADPAAPLRRLAARALQCHPRARGFLRRGAARDARV